MTKELTITVDVKNLEIVERLRELHAEAWSMYDAMETAWGAVTSQRADLAGAIVAALHELGVPGPNYPTPVANAVQILRAALEQNEV